MQSDNKDNKMCYLVTTCLANYADGNGDFLDVKKKNESEENFVSPDIVLSALKNIHVTTWNIDW